MQSTPDSHICGSVIARRKALLIVSDGGDNRSRYTEMEIRDAVREADVQIYAMGIVEPIYSRKPIPELARGPDLLRAIADDSGGHCLPGGQARRTGRRGAPGKSGSNFAISI